MTSLVLPLADWLGSGRLIVDADGNGRVWYFINNLVFLILISIVSHLFYEPQVSSTNTKQSTGEHFDPWTFFCIISFTTTPVPILRYYVGMRHAIKKKRKKYNM